MPKTIRRSLRGSKPLPDAPKRARLSWGDGLNKFAQAEDSVLPVDSSGERGPTQTSATTVVNLTTQSIRLTTLTHSSIQEFKEFLLTLPELGLEEEIRRRNVAIAEDIRRSLAWTLQSDSLNLTSEECKSWEELSNDKLFAALVRLFPSNKETRAALLTLEDKIRSLKPKFNMSTGRISLQKYVLDILRWISEE